MLLDWCRGETDLTPFENSLYRDTINTEDTSLPRYRDTY
jgi:hypothetical protein